MVSPPLGSPCCAYPLDLDDISLLSISCVANSHSKHYASKIPRLSCFFSRLDFDFNWKDAFALELDTVMNHGNSADDPFGLCLP